MSHEAIQDTVGSVGGTFELPPGQNKAITTAAGEEPVADKAAVGIGSDTILTVA